MAGAVVFADSQGSTATSELHGLQKLIVGDGFILGGSGHMLIITTLFREISRNNVAGADLHSFVERFIADEVEAPLRSQGHFLAATPSGPQVFQTLFGGILKRFTARGAFSSIGSGYEFVTRARMRNVALGIEERLDSLADVFVAAEKYADAADESLTVDNKFMVGMLVANKSYLMGDRSIGLVFAPPAIAANWPALTANFDEILGLARTIRSELRNAQRAFSHVATGALERQQVDDIVNAANEIDVNRTTLQAKLSAYMTLYDQVLGRP